MAGAVTVAPPLGIITAVHGAECSMPDGQPAPGYRLYPPQRQLRRYFHLGSMFSIISLTIA
jgi:hypothetical protein